MGSTSKNPPFSKDSLNGLKFGQKIYFEDVGIGLLAKSGGGSSSAPAPAKKCGGGVQPPMCQVEDCKLDLSDAKPYYGRHKVCGEHSKTPKVIVNGLEQRFCQQCSRFHQLAEFDQGKRSCRRRLAGHNERRRKPPPGSMFSPPYGRLSSSVFETGKGGSFLMDFSTYPKLTTSETWPITLIRPPPNHHHSTPMAQMVHSTMENPSANTPFPQGSLSGTRYHPVGPTTIPSGECFTGGAHLNNSGCALSLLSNQTQWVPHDGSFQGTQMAQIVHSTMATTNANQFTVVPWEFKGHDDDTGSYEIPQHLPRHQGLSQIAQPGDNHYSGNIGSSQQMQYGDLEHSRTFDSSTTQFINWLL